MTDKGGAGMDMKECTGLLSMIDRLIDTSGPQRSEYLRGYQRGMRVSVLGVSDERIEEHRLIMEYSDIDSGDPYIDSFARGYRDGFEGIAPEDPSLSSKSSGSSKSLLIASIV